MLNPDYLGAPMDEEQSDDLFATVKLLLDEVVVTPERPDRAVKAAVLLRRLESALYGTNRTEEVGKDVEDDDVVMGPPPLTTR